MANVMSFICGIIFAAGLVISSMINPNKVIGFLKIFSGWDYSLVFVMVGAVMINIVLFRIILRKKNPMFSKDFKIPQKNYIDSRIILGSIIFGIGWGLAGICPGPVMVNIVQFDGNYSLFVISMAVGAISFNLLDQRLGK